MFKFQTKMLSKFNLAQAWITATDLKEFIDSIILYNIGCKKMKHDFICRKIEEYISLTYNKRLIN